MYIPKYAILFYEVWILTYLLIKSSYIYSISVWYSISYRVQLLFLLKIILLFQDIPRSRLTADQRWIMVEFIKRHRATVWGRCAGPVAARKRAKVLAQMAKTLNSTADGAVKTPKKWLSVSKIFLHILFVKFASCCIIKIL